MEHANQSPTAAKWHAQRAEDLYRTINDQRGLAWLDVINARLHGNEASVAQQFSNEHSEHTIRPMLDGAHDATE